MTRIRNGRCFRWFTTLACRERARAVVRELQGAGQWAFFEEAGTVFKIFTRTKKER